MKYSPIRARVLATALAILSISGIRAFAQANVTLQSTNLIAFAGSNVTFVALPTGLPGDVFTNYVWHTSTNVQGPFSIVTGATNAAYTISPAEPANAGYYFVSLADISGGNVILLVSQLASLAVVDQAQVITPPQPLLLPMGATASFTVAASGTPPLGFTWFLNGNQLQDGGRISGSGTTNLIISNVQTGDTGPVFVVVTNSYSSATSQVANLTVLIPPGVISPPASVAGIASNNLTISINPAGSPQLFFQWFEGNLMLTDGTHFSGSQTSALTIINAQTTDSGPYTVVITNSVGSFTQPVNVVVDIPPAITSTNAASGKEGTSFAYNITASGSAPLTFGATGLPAGLAVNSGTGRISGTPSAFGTFNVTLFATNAAAVGSGPLTLKLASDVPGITNSLTAKGKQGTNFTFTISGSNSPTVFSASGLPIGLNVNTSSGLISGIPIVSGTFPITIGASNTYGGSGAVLTLTLATAVPVITSATNAAGSEESPGFSYTITATNSPTVFGATGLPLGLLIDTNTGIISGTPMIGGTFNTRITAANAWGVGSTNLQIAIGYQSFQVMNITNVTYAYSAPYLLDFAFSIYNENNQPVIRNPSDMMVSCFEGTNQIGDETAVIVSKASDKVLQTYLLMDYTFSMLATPGAISNMQAGAEAFVNESPVNAQFGVVEFHSQDTAPNVVSQFATSKTTLDAAISGIQTNYVQGNYAGSRVWDALNTAINEFDPTTNTDQQRYIVMLTDGNDDSSQLYLTQPDPVDYLVGLAQSNNVSIYAIGYGNNVDMGDLQNLTTNTGGSLYLAQTVNDLAVDFDLLVRSIGGQYIVRWATLQRDPIPFTPSFVITVSGAGALGEFSGVQTLNITNIDNSQSPPVTNVTQETIQVVPDYVPPDYAGNDTVGALNLVADAVVGPQNITLRAFYVPRFVRAFHIHYVPNFPVTPVLDHTNATEIMAGWSMVQTNDGAGGYWLTLTSSNISNPLTSIPYGALGNLVTFHFEFPDLLTAGNAFSSFTVDNSIYSSPTMFPNGQSFTLNTAGFITPYGSTPHGTPVPWLAQYGLTSPPYASLAAAELADPNHTGYAAWQDYIAGVSPLAPNDGLKVSATNPVAGKPVMLTFNSVLGRTYRIDTATTLGQWTTLLDGIPGTGNPITIPDGRNLSTVSAPVYYRVAVY